jgi:predicted nucleotidyltransferase
MSNDSQKALREIAPVLRQLWDRFHVKRAWLFGSRAAKQSRAQSDWDFLVEFDEPPGFDQFMGLRAGLETQLHGHIDLLSRTACLPRFFSAIEDHLIDVT